MIVELTAEIEALREQLRLKELECQQLQSDVINAKRIAMDELVEMEGKKAAKVKRTFQYVSSSTITEYLEQLTAMESQK